MQKEYNFEVERTEFNRRGRWLHPRKAIGIYKMKFKTKIEINENSIKINSFKQDGLFKRGFNSFSEGDRHVYIEDVKSINFGLGYMMGFLHILPIFMGIYILISTMITTMIQNIGLMFGGIIVFSLFVVPILVSVIFKSVKIKIKNQKPVCFPVKSFKDDAIIDFLNEINKKRNKTRIVDYNKISIITFIIIVFLLSGVTYGGKYYNNISEHIKQNSVQELKKAITNNLYYVDITFGKAKFIKRKNNQNFYIIEGLNDKIKIKEYIKRYKGKNYDICILKYYSKLNNKLILEEYQPFDDFYDRVSFVKYNKGYSYNRKNKELLEFNIPYAELNNEENLSLPVILNFYNKEEKVERFDEIYNFINSNFEQLFIENGDYKYFKRIGEYKSKYGISYVLKCINFKNEEEIIMYVENNRNASREEYDGIILTYLNYENRDLKLNEKTALDYYKLMVPEDNIK